MRTATYDDETKQLSIFTIRGAYDFEEVPRSVFEGLRDAPSAGEYYHANIKDQF